jgi:DNA polymerase III subunit epsilon
MREIVLDTETTGLDPESGHRIIEIGGVELLHCVPTGRTLHLYINPERDVPEDAVRVHGLTARFLADKPRFHEVVDEIIAFFGDARLVIHNAAFDMRFLNAEFRRLGRPELPPDRALDTLELARRKFPGAPASLDALCKRFAVDNSSREKHGALLDSELLAEVYLHLLGGRQPDLGLAATAATVGAVALAAGASRPYRAPRPHAPTPEELAAHAALVATLTAPIWEG